MAVAHKIAPSGLTYAAGVSQRKAAEVMGLLLGHRYSHETISAMTEEVLQAVEAFRRRPLPEEMAFVYLDGLYLKLLREGEGVVREVVYVALGVTPSGERRVLGYWLLPAESALGWEGVLGELWQRGLGRVLLFITDGLPGLPEAIRRVYPHPSCYLPPGPEKIEAAMLSRTIAAFCIIDDALQAMGHKDDPQTKVPSSVILTLAILAAMELGGKHNKALALAKDLNLFTHVPSPSRFNRRLHALYPLFLPLLHLLSQVWKNLHQAQAYALDTFPLPACENIRAPRSRLFPHKAYRGFIPSKRVYFHGLKLHLLVDDGKFIHEVNLTPGSLHDLSSLLLLPLDLPEGAELYMDRGYESHLYAAFPSGKHLEDLLREAQGIVPMVIRRGNSRRYVPWLQYLAIVGRRVVETVGGMLHAMFPRRIHAVTQEGFVIKVLSFVLAHNLKLLTQEMA